MKYPKIEIKILLKYIVQTRVKLDEYKGMFASFFFYQNFLSLSSLGF